MTRKIGIASAVWGASILLSRVIGLVREAVIGRTLGGSSEADVYWSAFVVPDFLNYLLAGGALSIVFIPIFHAYLVRGEEERGWEAFSAIASFLCLLLAALTAVLYVALPWLAPIVAPGFDDVQRAELVALTRIILPAQIFHVIGGLFSAALQAKDKHAVPALAPLVYTLCIVAGGLIGGREAGAYGFAWGVLAGSVLGPFALPLWACSKQGLRWSLRWTPRHPDLRAYFMRSLPIMLGWSIVVVDDWFLRREGSLLGAGAVSTLTYAKNLMKVPMGVFGLAAGVAAYPTLARLVAEKREREMFTTLTSTTRTLLVLSFAAQAVFSTCGYEIAALVYGRQRIGDAQLHEIDACLAIVSLGLCAWSAQTLIARGFYALGNTWLPAVLGTVIAALAYPLYVLLRTHLGVQGLALASSIAILVYVLILSALLRQRVEKDERVIEPGWTPFVVKCLGALAVSVATGRALRLIGPVESTTLILLLRALWTCSATIAVFLAVAYGLGLPEISTLWSPLRRRILADRPDG